MSNRTHKASLPDGKNSLRGASGNIYSGGYYGPRKEMRRADREERQTHRDSLTPQEQIARLDKRLGEGVGAQKERARLQKMIKGEAS